MGDYLTRTIAPVQTPVSIADIKANARIDSADEDALIATYLDAAVRSVEEMSGRALMAQTWALSTYGLTGNQRLHLPVTPVSALAKISYQDNTDTEQTMNVGDFYLIGDNYRAFVQPKAGTQWPSTEDRADAITVTFVAGYPSTDAVPEGLRHSVTLLATHWFENRTPIGPDKSLPLPFAVEHLIGLDKTGWVGA